MIITLLNGSTCATTALSPAEKRFYGVSKKKKFVPQSVDSKANQFADFIAKMARG